MHVGSTRLILRARYGVVQKLYDSLPLRLRSGDQEGPAYCVEARALVK